MMFINITVLVYPIKKNGTGLGLLSSLDSVCNMFSTQEKII